MVAKGCDDASTAAAVQDALCGSIAITTPGVFDIADMLLSLPGLALKARRAHQLSALQASLQPLPAGRTDPRRKPSRSQPTITGDRYEAGDLGSVLGDHGCRPCSPTAHYTSWYGG